MRVDDIDPIMSCRRQSVLRDWTAHGVSYQAVNDYLSLLSFDRHTNSPVYPSVGNDQEMFVSWSQIFGSVTILALLDIHPSSVSSLVAVLYI